MRFRWQWMLVIASIVGCAEDSSVESDTDPTTTTTTTMTSSADDSSSSSATSDPETTGEPEESEGDVSSSDGAATSSDSSAGGTTSGDALSFELDVWPVLAMERDPPLTEGSASCAACHGGGAGGLALPDAAGSYANLIDVPSTSALCAGAPRVTAGDPDGSCFVIFYEVRLRDQLAWVDTTETDLVRAWVASGAAP